MNSNVKFLSKNEIKMDNVLPNSIHIELKLKEPEFIDIETGEMIYLNGYNGKPDIGRLSVGGAVFISEQNNNELNDQSILDIDL